MSNLGVRSLAKLDKAEPRPTQGVDRLAIPKRYRRPAFEPDLHPGAAPSEAGQVLRLDTNTRTPARSFDGTGLIHKARAWLETSCGRAAETDTSKRCIARTRGQ